MNNATSDFFDKILPSDGFYAITTLKKDTPPQQFSLDSRRLFYKTLDQQLTLSLSNNRDIYYCISTLAQRSLKQNDGKIGVRVSANCRWTRSLVLDIDIDKSGKLKNRKLCFVSQEEAIKAVNLLCDTIPIPAPYIVSSGYGLHVYWPFETAVASEEWYKLALKFKTVVSSINAKFVADASRIADRAGILRVPGTKNYKDPTEPKYVDILHKASELSWRAEDYQLVLDQHIEKFKLEVVASTPAVPLANVKPPRSYLKPSVVGDLPDLKVDKIELKTLYDNCGVTKNYVDVPEGRDYDTWFAMLGLAAHIKHTAKDGRVFEGDEVAQILSKGYPSYDPESTSNKYKEAIRDTTKSVRTCTWFAGSSNAEICKKCVFRELIGPNGSMLKIQQLSKNRVVVNSPVNIDGDEVGSETQVLPPPPFPYEFGPGGVGVYIRQKGNVVEGEDAVKQIYEHTLIPISRSYDSGHEVELLELELRLPHEPIRRFSINGGDLQDEKKLRAIFGSKGIYAQKGQMELLVRYIIAYASTLQRSERSSESYTSFGWKNRGTTDAKFVLYDSVVMADGRIQSYANSTKSLKELAPYASSLGNLEEWKKAFAIYDGVPGMEPHIINLMLAFAAPLLSFVNSHGLIYSLYGAGGEGKSYSAKVASSVWGQPAEISHALPKDTDNAILDMLGTFGSIPMVMDEMTTMDDERLSDLAYAITNGRAKNRLNKNSERIINRQVWQTFVLTSSNESLYEKLAKLGSGNDAHGYRILEFEAPRSSNVIKERAHAANKILSQNYGLAGKLFMQYVMQNKAEIQVQVLAAQEALTRVVSSKERFWVSAQACIQVGGYIAKDLGLHPYEPGQLLEFMERKSPRDVVTTIAGDAISKLNDFLVHATPSTIKVFNDKIVNLDLDSRGVYGLTVRLEGNNNEIERGYILCGAIEMWCRRNNVDYAWLRSKLTENGVLRKTVRKRLGEGTKYFSASSHTWELDMQHVAIVGKVRTDTNVVVPIGAAK